MPLSTILTSASLHDSQVAIPPPGQEGMPFLASLDHNACSLQNMIMVSLAPKYREALKSFKAQLVAEFGSRLRRMVLFGSVSRGEERWDSDVDVLVLLDQVSHRERRHIIDLAADELTYREVLISPTIMSETDFLQMEARERLLPQEIARDGVLV